jgi:leader peptidase (prepilin peptidase)/N-methyltransferase
MSPQFIVNCFAFLLGAVVGSFLNVCIWRLPQGGSVVAPPSHCPGCGYRIRFYDNIPLVSYLLLGGRCRSCRTKISLQYPLVELLNGVLALLLMLRFGPGILFLMLFVFTSALVAVTFIDLEHQIIPDVITIPGIVAGFACSLFLSGPSLQPPFLAGLLAGGGSLALLLYGYFRSGEPETDEPASLLRRSLPLLAALPALAVGFWGYRVWSYLPWTGSLLGILLGGGIVWAIIELYYLLRKAEGMGGGDVKLLAMMGGFLGWQAVPFILFAASVVGSVIGLSIMAARRQDSRLAIPFGPFLAFGAITYIFYGPQIIAWYFGLGGGYGG